MIKPKDTYIEALEKIKAKFCDCYDWKHYKEETNLLQELIDSTKQPTVEEVLKEFEALGFRIGYYSLTRSYNLTGMGYIISIDTKGRKYEIRTDSFYHRYISLQIHQLLTKLFKALGWFDD